MSVLKLKNAAIIVFLAVQIGLPLPALFTSKTESEGNFSWTMYSHLYVCRATYLLVTEDGMAHRLDPRRFVARPQKHVVLFNRTILPDFHAYLCDGLRQKGHLGRLVGTVECSVDGHQAAHLVGPGADICDDPALGMNLP